MDFDSLEHEIEDAIRAVMKENRIDISELTFERDSQKWRGNDGEGIREGDSHPPLNEMIWHKVTASIAFFTRNQQE